MSEPHRTSTAARRAWLRSAAAASALACAFCAACDDRTPAPKPATSTAPEADALPAAPALELQAQELERAGRMEEARRAWERALAAGPRSPALMCRIATFELSAGDPERAELLAREACAVREAELLRAGALRRADLAPELTTLALVIRQRGRLEEALGGAREVVELLRDAGPGQQDARRAALTLYGSLLLDLARAAEAEAVLRQALEGSAAGAGAAQARNLLGACLGELGRIDEAEPLLRASVEELFELHGGHDFRARGALLRLAEFLQRTGRAEEAVALRQRLVRR